MHAELGTTHRLPHFARHWHGSQGSDCACVLCGSRPNDRSWWLSYVLASLGESLAKLEPDLLEESDPDTRRLCLGSSP